MKGRVFFINFLTTFKKLNLYTAKTLNTAKTQRIYLCDHKIFVPLRKFLRPCLAGRQVCGVSGQSTIEYLIILALIAAVVISGLTSKFGKREYSKILTSAQNSGEIIYNKAVSRMDRGWW